MGTNRSTILVDATMDLTGISDKSMKRVQKMIKENILSNNEINLEFNKSGKSAILKQLDVVYDRINNVKKLAASVNIGSSQYKMSIDDYSGKKKDVLKASKDIAAQEEKINALKEKGRKTTAAEKAELKELKATLKEMNENRELLAKGLIKDTSLKGSSRYASSNLLTSKVSKTSSTTKLTTDEKLLNEQYDKQAFLIKSIAKLEVAEATTNAKRLSDELAALKSLTAETEERIRLKQSSANAESTISTAQAKATSATSEAAGITEIAVVKQRNTALNEYKRILRELEKEEYNLARATSKQKASVMNQTTESNESISSIEKRISKLKSEAELQKKITNTKYAGDAAGDTKQYTEALKVQSDHLSKVSSAQKKANSEFAKTGNVLGMMNENFRTAASRILDYTLVYRSLWAVMNKVSQAIQTIIELNKAFTDIQMVTGYNEKQINDLEDSYSSLAKTMGATVDQVANAATEWFFVKTTINPFNCGKPLRDLTTKLS